MPRVFAEPALVGLLERQDGVVTHEQLRLLGLGRTAADKRVGRGQWRRLAPGVYLTSAGEPTRRQMVVGAWLRAGPDSAIDGVDACRWYGLDLPLQHGGAVHVVVPEVATVRSRGGLIRVRRAMAEIRIGDRGLVPYVDCATALVVAAREATSPRAAIDVLSRGLQAGFVDLASLHEARDAIGDKWCRGVDQALVAVGVGVRSNAEEDHHRLLATSRLLPEPEWNAWLDLGDAGPPVCADTLWPDAGVVQEVNGRRYHAWGDQFERTEARRARMTAAGLVVMSCTPVQVRVNGATVVARLERAYVANEGRGLPPGVRQVPPSIARYTP